MREYRATLKAQKNGREFHRGAEAMRQVIVEHMEGVGLEHFNGHSAAEFARRVQLESVG